MVRRAAVTTKQYLRAVLARSGAPVAILEPAPRIVGVLRARAAVSRYRVAVVTRLTTLQRSIAANGALDTPELVLFC